MNKTNTDLVLIFKKIIGSIKQYTDADNINLNFTYNEISIIVNFKPDEIEDVLFNLLHKIILFTPKNEHINIYLKTNYNPKPKVNIEIENSGIDLFRVTEITTNIPYSHSVNSKSNGTLYKIKLPLDNNLHLKTQTNNLGYNPYYMEVQKRLSSHFSDIEVLEIAATKINTKSSVFIKKMNKIITIRMGDHNFKVEQLADALAISRSQLYRKIKHLTQLSPRAYLLFFRLHAAKNIIDTKVKDLNISEIAFKVGFVSTSHFSRSFLKQFNLNPLQYKKRNMQAKNCNN